MIETFCVYGWKMNCSRMLELASKYASGKDPNEAFDSLGMELSKISGVNIQCLNIGDSDCDAPDLDFVFGVFDCEGMNVGDIHNLYVKNRDAIEKLNEIFGEQASICSGYFDNY